MTEQSTFEADFSEAEGGVGVGAIEGKVALYWRTPSNMIAFDPKDAKTVAEQLVKVANTLMN